MKEHWTLDPQVRFLNHGSFGACPRPVLEAQAELRARMEREPVVFLARGYEQRLDAAREPLAAFVGAAPEDVAFVPNATTGVNAVVRSLVLAPGDEILVTDHGYNACRNVVDFVCERSGARVVVVNVPFPITSTELIVDGVLAAVTPRTRLALLDHVTSPTALVYPIERLVAELRERGVDTLVDGAHAPGMLPLDLENLGAAYYTGNCHKWMCAPKGAGFLWVRRDKQEGVRPAVISHGANEPPRGRGRFRQEFDWCGTVDPTPWLTIPAALEFLTGLCPGGIPELRERNRGLALEGRSLLCSALDVPPPAPDAAIGSIASVPMPLVEEENLRSAWDVDPLQRELLEQHAVEVPIFVWPSPRVRLLRISAQAYNTREDYAVLAAALRPSA